MEISTGPPTAVPESMELELDVQRGPLVFGDADTTTLGAMTTPQAISGKSQEAQRWPKRRTACRGGTARKPDLYLHADQALSQVQLSLFRSGRGRKVHVYGPLETIKPFSQMHCDKASLDFQFFEGTYAVWVLGDVDQPYTLATRQTHLPVDPLTTLVPIAETVSIAARRLGDHYPFMDKKDDRTVAWLGVPERLFVYSGVALKTNSGELTEVGEPLLVADRGAARRPAAHR